MTVKLMVFLFAAVNCVAGRAQDHIFQDIMIARRSEVMDVTDFSIYYNLETNEDMKLLGRTRKRMIAIGIDFQTIRKMMPRPWYRPGWLLRLPYMAGPCKCEALKCSCCAGIRVQAFNFDRKACTVLTFEPLEAAIHMEVTMNETSIYRNTFSAKNPPPFCVPIPVPYLPPGLMDLCIRLFEISIVDQRLHVCMDWDTRIDKAPVLILHFDCMDMGFNGVGLSKPGSHMNQTTTQDAATEPIQENSDVYDPVTEKMQSTTQYPFKNVIKYISK